MAGLFSFGSPFQYSDDERKNAAWAKATPIPSRDPDFERWDCDLNVIRRQDYGSLTTYGWEIDHIIALAIGGSDDLSNLLHGTGAPTGALVATCPLC